MAADDKKERRIVEAGLAPHMAASLPRFSSQTKLQLAGGRTGSVTSGIVVESLRLTPRGLEVVHRGEHLVIGQGSWTYVIERGVDG